MKQKNQSHWIMAQIAEQEAPGSTINLWSQVQARVASPIAKTHKTILSSRKMQVTFGLMLILSLIGSFTFVPAARAFVVDIYQRITSQVIVTTIENGVVTEKKMINSDNTEPLTLEEAQAQVDFTIRLPAYLPRGYSLTRFDIYPGSRGMVTILFDTQVDSSGRVREFFELHESKDEGIYAGGETLEEVLINGNAVIWAQDVSTTYDDAGNPSPLIANKLYWEDGGIYFTLRSYYLSQQELIKIAASIK